MEPSAEGRCGDVVSDLSIIVITAVQWVFFTRFHRYIAWPSRGADGGVTWLPVLTDDYFSWLPFPVAASVVVIVGSIIMILYNRDWFRQAGWILFPLMGVMVTVALVTIFPFDFSVIPNARTAEVVPVVVRVFFVLAAVFYGIAALVTFVRFIKRYSRKQETR